MSKAKFCIAELWHLNVTGLIGSYFDGRQIKVSCLHNICKLQKSSYCVFLETSLLELCALGSNA